MIRITASIATILICILFCSCEQEEVGRASNKDSILLLEVAYSNHAFENGIELEFSQNTATTDTIPVKVIYKKPCDFGSLTLLHAPTNDTVFSGSVIWSGCGVQSHPKQMKQAEAFDLGNVAISTPAVSRFQTIFVDKYFNPPHNTIPYDAIWSAVSKLNIVADYNNAGNKIGLFLYTPGIGMGSHTDWRWFIVMKK